MRENAVYARQSVEKKNSLSISGQIALCRQASGDDKLLEYKDSGYSGKNTERPDFKRLLSDIKADRIGTLYVYRLDRFSRSVADFGQLWEILRAHGVEFVSVNESFDTKTPMGRAMLHIIMVFAQLERETTAERVKDNYYRRALLGQWPGGPAPYGYDNGRIFENGRAVPALTPNDSADTVREIFARYADEGSSLGSIARQLNANNVKGVKRGTWDNVMLSRLLHNPVYVMADEQVRLYLLAQGINVSAQTEDFDGVHGVLVIGKRASGEKPSSEKQGCTASLLNSTGLVSAELWLKCQEKLLRNRQIGNSGKGKHSWLSGLLKCACCGYSIKISCRNEKRRMICSGRYNLAKCTAIVDGDIAELEECVGREIDRLLQETSCGAEPERVIENEPLIELDRRIERLIDAFVRSDMNRDYFERALIKLENEKKNIAAKVRQTEELNSKAEMIRFSELTFEERKALAPLFLERINVAENAAEVIWRV